MDAQIAGEKVFSSTAYTHTGGSFGIDVGNDCIIWYTCREQFHKAADLSRLNNFYYGILFPTSNKEQILALAGFIYKIEEHLHIEDKTSFMYTNDLRVIFVSRMASFWLEQPMRSSFFSIALRAGYCYKPDSDWAAILLSYPYANETKEAVYRFLEGCTDYTGVQIGWKRAFYGEPMERIRRLLIKPEAPEVRHQKIAKMANWLWEGAGQPIGKDLEHWWGAMARYYQMRFSEKSA